LALKTGVAMFPTHDAIDPGAPADAKVLERFAEAGFSRAVHWVPSALRGPVERELERWESAITELNGG
jgi:hypothetical protein